MAGALRLLVWLQREGRVCGRFRFVGKKGLDYGCRSLVCSWKRGEDRLRGRRKINARG
jgi:hypothetical protein